MQASVGAQGMVRVWEVTDGAKGWHPHAHLLMFYQASAVTYAVALAAIREAVWTAWERAAGRCGLVVDRRACSVQGGRAAALYLLKLAGDDSGGGAGWGLAREVTGSAAQRKVARRGGRTPWAILAAAAEGDPQARRRWREYARAMRGRRYLVWSRGLRAKLALSPDRSDLEVAGAPATDSAEALVVTLTDPEWAVARRMDLCGLLELAELEGRAGVLAAVYRRMYPGPRGPPGAAPVPS